jgi:tetratricopeptide (TPR) repeat protein
MVARAGRDGSEGDLMLLNRKRVKFWQKIVFGFMAALMAGFLIFGYSGVASSCGAAQSTSSGSSAIDSQVKAAVATLAKNPTDAAALLSAAQGYQAAGTPQSSGQTVAAPTAGQTNDLTKALGYYERYIKLPDSKLGATAAGQRFNALKNEAIIYNALIDYQGAVAVVKKMLKLQPRNYDLYLTIASNEVEAGDTAAAIAAYTTYLKLDPHSQYAAQVKTALASLEGSSSPSPSATP